MSQPMPPQYPGMGTYYPQSIERLVTRRNVFWANGFGLFLIFVGVLFRLAASDTYTRGFAHFLIISGGMLGAVASLAGGLGSKRTSEMQNVGLLVWAGLLLAFTFSIFNWVG